MIKQCLIRILKFYSFYISYLFAPRCRFYPSCSHYAIEAIETHGTIKGLYLSVIRLLKCQPFCEGGHDPVPPKHSNKNTSHAHCIEK